MKPCPLHGDDGNLDQLTNICTCGWRPRKPKKKTAKLTRSQKRVLELLAEKGPLQTTRTTHHGSVSGRSASGLIARNWAKYVFTRTERFGISQCRVEITELGRQALREAAE
jgi:hypothetical protein